MSSLRIVLGKGLAVTAPPPGQNGEVSLTPVDTTNDRQVFTFEQPGYIVSKTSPGSALELKPANPQNVPTVGTPVHVSPKAPSFNQFFVEPGADGVVYSWYDRNLTLGFGSVVAVDKNSALAQAAAPDAQVTLQNRLDSGVYIAFEYIPKGQDVTISVPKGKTLYAIDEKGNHVIPKRVIDGNATIPLEPQIKVEVINTTTFQVKLVAKNKATDPPVFLNPAVNGANSSISVTNCAGTIYEAYDPLNNKLMFVDSLTNTGSDSFEIKTNSIKYTVVVPSINTFVNATTGLAVLTPSAKNINSEYMQQGTQRLIRAAPGTTYSATNGDSKKLVISRNGSSQDISNQPISETGSFFYIKSAPTYRITIVNSTLELLTVTVGGEKIVENLLAGQSIPKDLTEGAVLVGRVPSGQPVSPAQYTVSKDDSISFSTGIQVPPNEKAAIEGWLPGKKFQLIYKGSKDGFENRFFHAKCEDKGPTITIITSAKGNRFGGYTPLSWKGGSGYGEDTTNTSFIFTLKNPHGINSTKYALIKPKSAIIFNGNSSALFGGGYDIGVVDATSATKNITNFPFSYADTTAKGNATFDGAVNFSVAEIEVYTVV